MTMIEQVLIAKFRQDRQILLEAIQKECAKFNFPDEDRPILGAALQKVAL